MRLIGFAIYLGCGAMLHAIFVGAHFDWQSAWTIGWLLGWPIMMVVTFFGFIMTAAILIAMFFIAWSWLDMVGNWLARRKLRGMK